MCKKSNNSLLLVEKPVPFSKVKTKLSLILIMDSLTIVLQRLCSGYIKISASISLTILFKLLKKS